MIVVKNNKVSFSYNLPFPSGGREGGGGLNVNYLYQDFEFVSQ